LERATTTVRGAGGYFPAISDQGPHKKKRKAKRRTYEIGGPSTENADAVELKSASIDGFVTELARRKRELEALELQDFEDLLQILDLL
jgi:hypothetical protein